MTDKVSPEHLALRDASSKLLGELQTWRLYKAELPAPVERAMIELTDVLHPRRKLSYAVRGIV